MERLKNLSVLTALLAAALVATACGDNTNPASTCGPGTQNVNGRCESIITCGPGTVAVNSTCQPAAGAGACGAGTEAVGGQCVPSAETCGVGTRLVDGACVLDGLTACGAGTELDDSDQCQLVEDLSCGPGTVETDATDDDGVTSIVLCELTCGDGQLWDQAGESCVDQCGSGTQLDAATNTCAPLCNESQYFVASSGSCVDVPECLRNADLVDGDCLGWPFNELTLETLCARRAANVCEPIFDPDCACDHGGEFNLTDPIEGGRDHGVFPSLVGSFELYFPAEMASCLAVEYDFCESNGIALARALLAEDPPQIAQPSAEALAAFDDHFPIAADACTRPVTWDPWPADLLDDLITGQVATGDRCLHYWACGDGDNCLPVDEPPYDTTHEGSGEAPPADLGSLDRGLLRCQPRIAANERCVIPSVEAPDVKAAEVEAALIEPAPKPLFASGFLPIDLQFCVADHTCMQSYVTTGTATAAIYPETDDNDDRVLRCLAPRAADARCDGHDECASDLVCRPKNISQYLVEVDPPALDAPTCQPAITAGNRCPTILLRGGWANDAGDGTFRTFRDVCSGDDYCNDATITDLDGEGPGTVGLCEAAHREGGACDWCREIALYPQVVGGGGQQIGLASSNYDRPHLKNGFSICEGELNCTLTPGETAPTQTCSANLSVCPAIASETFLVNGLCAENSAQYGGTAAACSDVTGEQDDPVDNDGDDYANCDDPDCFAYAAATWEDGDPPNCYENICTGGLDEDQDTFADCLDCEDCGDVGDCADIEAPCHCADGIDNDEANGSDCVDSSCCGTTACPCGVGPCASCGVGSCPACEG